MAHSVDTFPTIPQAAALLLANFLRQFGEGAVLHDHRRDLGLGDDHINALAMLVANGLLLVTVLHLQQRGHRDQMHASAASARATTSWAAALGAALVGTARLRRFLLQPRSRS